MLAAHAVAARTGEILQTEEYAGGVVHRVIRVRGTRGSVILKHRGQACHRIPEAPLRPQDILIEATALQRINRILPAATPRLLTLDDANHILVLSDLRAPGLHPGPAFLHTASLPAVRSAGAATVRAVAQLNRDLPGDQLRPEDPDQFLVRQLSTRIGYHDTRGCQRLAEHLLGQDREFSLGDPSPKNLLLGPARVALFDFEQAHAGPRGFDLAHVLAHWLLHRLHIDTATELAYTSSTILAAYQAERPLGPSTKAYLGQLVAALAAFRLRHPLLHYPLALDADRRNVLTDRALTLVDRIGTNAEEVTHQLADLHAAITLPDAPASRA
ncbi:MAG: phosphotransferase [Pseudonocardiaceae bacterium]